MELIVAFLPSTIFLCINRSLWRKRNSDLNFSTKRLITANHRIFVRMKVICPILNPQLKHLLQVNPIHNKIVILGEGVMIHNVEEKLVLIICNWKLHPEIELLIPCWVTAFSCINRTLVLLASILNQNIRINTPTYELIVFETSSVDQRHLHRSHHRRHLSFSLSLPLISLFSSKNSKRKLYVCMYVYVEVFAVSLAS
nr:hypothetical protein Iba_chr02aCG23240 [Ipomoea batatas]